MKKASTVVAVLIVVLVLFTAQNGLAQKDPFEIGKRMAKGGKFDSPFWSWGETKFKVSYNTEKNKVAFEEYPESRNGTAVFWIKDIGQNTYSKYTSTVENGEMKKGTTQIVSITKEKAEQEAWRILGHFGYSQ